jgi:hypothetical protein
MWCAKTAIPCSNKSTNDDKVTRLLSRQNLNYPKSFDALRETVLNTAQVENSRSTQ